MEEEKRVASANTRDRSVSDGVHRQATRAFLQKSLLSSQLLSIQYLEVTLTKVMEMECFT